jgi:hypothetical protein
MDHLMTILKPLKDMTMLTPYEQYFIQSLHQEGQLILEQHPGEKNLLLQLATELSYIPLEETSQATSFIPYTVPCCRSPDPTFYNTGMYTLTCLIYILDPTCLSLHFFQHNKTLQPRTMNLRILVYHIH